MCVGWVLMSAIIAGAEKELTRWTSVQGATVEARFVRVEGKDLVVLETDDGKQLAIALGDLTVEDRARVQGLEEGLDEGAFAPTRLRNAWLPMFESGPYMRNFAVVDHPLYLFVMDGAGASTFYLKDDQGELVGPPIPMRGLRVHYVGPHPTESGRTTSHSRPVDKLTGPPLKPLLNPKSFVLTGLFQDDVAFKCAYVFTPDSVTVDFEVTDPPGITYPTRGGETGFKFAQSAEISHDTLQDERKRILDGWSLTLIQEGRGADRRMIIPFWEAVHQRPQGIVEAISTGPWGPRSISVQFRGLPGRAGIYEGRSLWEGYSMGFSWHYEKIKKTGLTITIK